MKKTTTAMIGIIGLLAFLAGTASATSTLSAKFTGIGPNGGAGVSVYYTPDSGSAVTANTTAGEYLWQVISAFTDEGDSLPSVDSTFPTFCIDVEGRIQLNHTYSWNVLSGKDEIVGFAPSRMPPGGAIQGGQYDRLLKLYALFYNKGDGSWTNTEAAAFGASVWEIVWESPASKILPTSYDVDADLLRVYNNTAVINRAQHMLDDVLASDVVPYGELYALVNTTAGQDQMIAFGVGSNNVPEPLTLLAIGSAGMGLAGYVRRRRLA